VEEVVVDKILFEFAMYGSFPEIFEIKVESCQKSRRILDVFFDLPNFNVPRGLPKVIPILSPVPYGTSNGKSFVRILPLAPKFYLLIRLNFKPDFKFSRLFFLWGGPPSLLGCALASLPQSLAHVRAQRPLRAEILYAKKVHFSGSKLTIRSM